jgi:hypothetical protein
VDITTVLAVVGAVSGLFSLTLSVLKYRKDRPLIVVTTHPLSDSDGSMYLVVEVRNEGLHGVSVTGIGQAVSSFKGSSVPSPLRLLVLPLLVRHEKRIRRNDVSYSELGVVLDDEGNETEEVEYVEPGKKTKPFQIPMSVAYSRQGEDRLSWGYAEDFSGRMYFSELPAHVQPVKE